MDTEVACVELVEDAAQLRSVALRAARHFAEYLLRARLAELLHLSVDALAVGRNTSVAVNYWCVVVCLSKRRVILRRP